MTNLLERFKAGLWYDNPGLVQLLGLCPLLAVTSTFVNGLGLGIATLSVMTISNALVSATRRWIRSEIRIPIYGLIIATFLTLIIVPLLFYIIYKIKIRLRNWRSRSDETEESLRQAA